jgi:hypothetical protein
MRARVLLTDLANFKGQGKLTRAYKKGTQQWGTIEIVITVPVKKLGPLPLDKAIDFQAKLTLDTVIDGSATEGVMKANMALKGRSEFTQNNMTFTIDITVDGDYRRDQSAEK